jgi:magnesium-transporting ATPase (P-type)
MKVGFFSNRMVWAGIACDLIIILVILYVPFFQEIVGTAPFPLENWLFLIAWTPALLIAEELRKGVVRMIESKKNVHKHPGGIT